MPSRNHHLPWPGASTVWMTGVVVDSLAWHPDAASTPLLVDLGAYFERVLDA